MNAPNANAFVDFDSGDNAWSDAHANFLSSLSTEETQDLLKRSRRLNLKSRDHLFRAGDSSNDIYIVASGCIRLFQVSSTGKETILWLGFAGEIFGMAEVWRGNDRQIGAVANEATQVYSISRRDFTDFLGAHPEAAMKAISILSARVRALGHVLVGLASDNVETRIARLLVRFAAVSSGIRCCAGPGEGELCVNVRLTHQDIANLIGASRQTVTTTLAHLRKRGAVRMVEHHFHIMQPDHLRHLLDVGAA
ncbi:MAG: Crp/Fnr family transcriptional regulator [Gammaproteobacteria bacterium]|jgi:CRP-like cAMP-binding protein|nr:Crp/Fnr family transcriptional regulator [Gammaproteobacteria bacterium]